jgi:hypothetical protein
MPYSVGKIPRPLLGIQEDLRTRWQKAQTRLERIIPPDHPARALLSQPCDEFIVEGIEDEIAKYLAAKAAAQPQQSAMVERLQDKMSALKSRYHTAQVNHIAVKKAVRRLVGSRCQAIMRQLPMGWEKQEFPPISLSVSDAIIFSDYDEAKRIVDELELETFYIESCTAALNTALAFEELPPGAANVLGVIRESQSPHCSHRAARAQTR